MLGGLLWGGFQFDRAPRSAWAQKQAQAPKAGNLQVDVQLQPDPPRQRKNVVAIAVKDASGKPVEQAQVAVAYSMAAMGSMPEMRGEAQVKAMPDGHYEAPFDLVMGGTWTLDVTVTAPMGKTTSRYEFTVGKAGLQPVQSKVAPAKK
jgi:hypothetical protein